MAYIPSLSDGSAQVSWMAIIDGCCNSAERLSSSILLNRHLTFELMKFANIEIDETRLT